MTMRFMDEYRTPEGIALLSAEIVRLALAWKALGLCAPLLGGLAGFGSVPPAPVAVADRTMIDEQGLLGLELAYKAARMVAETGVDAGLIRGDVALKVAQLDNAAFRALGVARGAYRAGNADSYAAALSEGRTSIVALLAIAGK